MRSTPWGGGSSYSTLPINHCTRGSKHGGHIQSCEASFRVAQCIAKSVSLLKSWLLLNMDAYLSTRDANQWNSKSNIYNTLQQRCIGSNFHVPTYQMIVHAHAYFLLIKASHLKCDNYFRAYMHLQMFLHGYVSCACVSTRARVTMLQKRRQWHRCNSCARDTVYDNLERASVLVMLIYSPLCDTGTDFAPGSLVIS